jgi:cell division protein FtsW
LQQVRLLAAFILAVGLVMLVATPIIGVEIKGARRWLNFGGLSIQISEFIKPAFAVVTAWLFTQRVQKPHLLTHYMAIVLWMVVVGLLLLQPDLGMAVVITAIWVVEFFLMGVPITWVVICAILCVGGITTAYYLFPHVSSRIDRFLDPSHGDCYQISRSLDAFMNGGWTGKGPGEGVVKRVLPDAHADFVFAVIGEEFGVLLCLLIVGMFAVLVFQSLRRVFQDHDLFTIMAVTGLAVQIGLQAIVNMASALHLIPTKGMTLPFLSYGGSSLLALSVAMGMLLALTRRRLV